MRRILAWSIPLALIVFGLLWPLVFRGGSEASDGSRPRRLQQLQRGLRRRAPTGGSTRSKPLPGNSPAAGTASSGTGTSPTRTTRGCGRNPRSPRCCWTANRCPTKCCGRTASGSGWPRSATRTATSPAAPTFSRSATPSPASSTPAAPAPTSNSPNPPVIRTPRPRSSGTSSRRPGTTDRTGRHLGHAARRGHRRAMLGRLRRRPGVPGSGRHGEHGEVGGPDLPPRTPVTLRAGVDVPTPPQLSLPWPYTWDRILGQSVTGVLWVAGPHARGRAGRVPLVSHHRRTVAGISAAVRAAGRTRTRADGVHPHRKRSKNSLTATLFYLAERRMIELRQVNDEAVERPWAGRHLRMGPGGSGEPQGRYRAQGEPARHRVRGEEDRQVRRETQQSQDGYGQGGAEMGIRRRPDGQAQEGTVGAHRQCDRIGSGGVRILSAGVSRPLCGACHSRRSSCSPRGPGSAV